MTCFLWFAGGAIVAFLAGMAAEASIWRAWLRGKKIVDSWDEAMRHAKDRTAKR